jgi:hypothetical protein
VSDRAKITHVAVRWHEKVYSLPEPNRHHHVLRLISETEKASYIPHGEKEEGFLDAEGRFLNRAQAVVSAIQNDQVKDVSKIRLGMLFSEDLW